MTEIQIRETMIKTVEDYFANVDSGNVSGVLKNLSSECELTVVTDNLKHKGRDTGIKALFERRLLHTRDAWHGNFMHLVDEDKGWVTSRFDVHRTDNQGNYREMHNINFFEFKGKLLNRICIWMSGENSLV